MRAIRKLLHWIWVGLDGLRKILHLLLLLLIFAPDRRALLPARSRSSRTRRRSSSRRRARSSSSSRATRSSARSPTRCGRARSRRGCATSSTRSRPPGTTSASARSTSTSAASTAAARPSCRKWSRAIDDFRKSGKPVIAFGEYYDQPQYYVAAHADEIYLDPQGIAYIDGFANYGLFVKDALDKLSIDWNVFRVGPVQVRRRDVHAQRHVAGRARGEPRVAQLGLGHLEGGRRQGARHRAGGASRPTPTTRRRRCARPAATSPRWRSTPGSSPSSRVATRSRTASPRSRARTRTCTRTRASTSRRTSRTCIRPRRSSSKPVDKVAVIVASGEILPGEQAPGTIGSDTLAAQLREARFDDDVKAVVLRIDSPGGSTFASEVIRREVAELQGRRQAGGRLDEHARGVGRLLHRDGRRPHRREPGDADRLDRHLRDVPDVPALARAARRARRRRRHDRAVGRVQPGPADERCHPGRAAAEHRPRIPALHHAGGEVAQEGRRRGRRRSRRAASGRAPTRSASASSTSSAATQDAIKLAAKLADLGKDYDVEYYDYVIGIGEALGFRVQHGDRAHRRAAAAAKAAPRGCRARCSRSPRSSNGSTGCATRATSTCTVSPARSTEVGRSLEDLRAIHCARQRARHA